MPVNLRTKLTLTVSALLITSVFGIVYLSLLYYEHQSKQVIAAQQLTMLHALAHELDNKLATAQDILVSASRVVPPEALRDPEAAQHFLDQRVELHALFDNHLFLFTPEGRLIAESPFLPNRRRLDLSGREYIRRTVAERKPYISEPYVSTQAHKHPVVMFTAPLLDSNGRVSGLLGGSVDLLGHNFLGRLAESTVGARGYFYLINDQRTLIVHHDTERVLTRVPPGKNRALDRTLAEGFEGSAETITSTGVPALASFQRLHVKPNWVLAASYPLDEAYAPIYRMRQRVFWGTVLGIVLIFLASALVIRYLTGPLRQLTADVQALAVQGGGTPLAEPGRGGELDELARSVNRLLEDLNLQIKRLTAKRAALPHYRGLLHPPCVLARPRRRDPLYRRELRGPDRLPRLRFLPAPRAVGRHRASGGPLALADPLGASPGRDEGSPRPPGIAAPEARRVAALDVPYLPAGSGPGRSIPGGARKSCRHHGAKASRAGLARKRRKTGRGDPDRASGKLAPRPAERGLHGQPGTPEHHGLRR